MNRSAALGVALLLALGSACSLQGCGAPKPEARKSDVPKPIEPQAGQPQPGRPQLGINMKDVRAPIAASKTQLAFHEAFNIRGQRRQLDPKERFFRNEVLGERRIENIRRKQALMLKIDSGMLAAPGDWPWAAALLCPCDRFGGLYLFCGGSLVAKDWVLTAAHCDVWDTDIVLVGETDISHPVGGALGVDRVCVHPGFDRTSHDFDLALVKLRTPVESKSVLPLEETNPSDAAQPSSATVIGWGMVTDGGTYSTDLLAATIPLLSGADCTSAYPGVITANMLCGGDSSSSGACRGDSGGPLMVNQASSPGWYQLGVSGFGDACAVPQQVGVYTRVDQLRQWINDTINGDFSKCKEGDD